MQETLTQRAPTQQHRHGGQHWQQNHPMVRPRNRGHQHPRQRNHRKPLQRIVTRTPQRDRHNRRQHHHRAQPHPTRHIRPPPPQQRPLHRLVVHKRRVTHAVIVEQHPRPIRPRRARSSDGSHRDGAQECGCAAAHVAPPLVQDEPHDEQCRGDFEPGGQADERAADTTFRADERIERQWEDQKVDLPGDHVAEHWFQAERCQRHGNCGVRHERYPLRRKASSQKAEQRLHDEVQARHADGSERHRPPPQRDSQ